MLTGLVPEYKTSVIIFFEMVVLGIIINNKHFSFRFSIISSNSKLWQPPRHLSGYLYHRTGNLVPYGNLFSNVRLMVLCLLLIYTCSVSVVSDMQYRFSLVCPVSGFLLLISVFFLSSPIGKQFLRKFQQIDFHLIWQRFYRVSIVGVTSKSFYCRDDFLSFFSSW